MTVIRVFAADSPPGALSTAHIRSSSAIMGGPWKGAATLVNHLLTSGAQLICANAPNISIAGAGSHVFRYYAWPRAINRRCVWVIYMGATSSSDTAAVTLTGDTESTTVAAQYATNATGLYSSLTDVGITPVFFDEQHDYAGGAGEMTLTVEPDVGVTVYRIACFEVARLAVELGNGDGVAGNIGSGYAIAQSTESGLYGLAMATEQAKTDQTRTCFHWYGSSFSTSSASFQTVFQLPPRVLIPRMSAADGTTGTIQWAARVENATGSGEVRLTASSGGTSTVAFSSGAAQWITGTLTVDREDLTTADGGQSGRAYGDAITWEIRRNSGGTAHITGAAMAYT